MTKAHLTALVAVFFCAALGLAWAQAARDPRPVAATCAYSTSPPTVITGNFAFVQCNSLGKLLVH
jgi:hypothetical protein